MTAQTPPGRRLDERETSRRPSSPRSRATLDEVFGDVLPTATRDDVDDREAGHSAGTAIAGTSHGEADLRHDEHLRREVPPHHA